MGHESWIMGHGWSDPFEVGYLHGKGSGIKGSGGHGVMGSRDQVSPTLWGSILACQGVSDQEVKG